MAKTQTQKCHCCDGTGKEIDHKLMGARMRSARERIKVSLTEMAGRLKISKAYVSDLERGHRYWSDDKLARYREALK